MVGYLQECIPNYCFDFHFPLASTKCFLSLSLNLLSLSALSTPKSITKTFLLSHKSPSSNPWIIFHQEQKVFSSTQGALWCKHLHDWSFLWNFFKFYLNHSSSWIYMLKVGTLWSWSCIHFIDSWLFSFFFILWFIK